MGFVGLSIEFLYCKMSNSSFIGRKKKKESKDIESEEKREMKRAREMKRERGRERKRERE